MKVIPKNIDYHLGTKQKKLNQLASKDFQRTSKQQVLGFASISQTISKKMSGQTDQIAPGIFCTRVKSLNIEIRVIKLDIYVLGKYPRGSCQYAAIIDHEHEHITTYQTGINNLERTLNHNLWNIIRRLPPGTASTPKKATQIAYKNLEHSLSQVQAPILRAMKYRNRQIDTPLSYKILKQQCATW